jgi:Cu(I)/Ag(I) efflux system membrane fusion protein
MYATVRFNTAAQSALAVPRSAVVQTGERALVFVDMGGGQLMPHAVTLGRSGSDYIEVLSGVDAGQRVVTSAQFLIDSESNLSELMKGMAGMGPPPNDPAGRDAKGMSDKGADMRDMPGMSTPPKR